MGDLNGRVGNDSKIQIAVLGANGEHYLKNKKEPLPKIMLHISSLPRKFTINWPNQAVKMRW